MIRVGLVTTWEPERCGVATYSSDFINHVTDKDIEFKIIDRPFTAESILERLQDCQVVHINHVWALFGALTTKHIRQLRAQGKKVLCQFNESTSFNRSEFTEAFDRVTVHNKTSDGFDLVPHGLWNFEVPEYDGSMEDYVGFAGFPVPHKNHMTIAKVIRDLGYKLFAFMPESPHADAQSEIRRVMSVSKQGSVIRSDYVHQTEIIRELSKCLFTVFAHHSSGGGISGSVRLGISARRPIVLSEAVRFQDIIEYEDEVYVVRGELNESSIGNTCKQVIEDIRNGVERIPNKVIEDMQWSKTAAMYVSIYREMMQ